MIFFFVSKDRILAAESDSGLAGFAARFPSIRRTACRRPDFIRRFLRDGRLVPRCDFPLAMILHYTPSFPTTQRLLNSCRDPDYSEYQYSCTVEAAVPPSVSAFFEKKFPAGDVSKSRYHGCYPLLPFHRKKTASFFLAGFAYRCPRFLYCDCSRREAISRSRIQPSAEDRWKAGNSSPTGEGHTETLGYAGLLMVYPGKMGIQNRCQLTPRGLGIQNHKIRM